jgi:hypothetical protein
MRIAYTLEEADLEAMVMQLSRWRDERVRAWLARVRTGPVWRHLAFNLLVGIPLGALVLPLWAALIHELASLYPVVLALALVIVTTMQRFKAPPRFQLAPLSRWSVRRQLRHSRARSVLGPIEIALGDGGLVRKNPTGEANIPWSEVRALLESPSLFTLALPSNRVVIAPRRAFSDEESARAFRAEVERRTGKPAIAVPETP